MLFPLYEMFRKGKSLETEGRLLVAAGWGGEGLERS